MKTLNRVTLSLLVPCLLLATSVPATGLRGESKQQEALPSPSDIIVTPPPAQYADPVVAVPVKYAKYKINYWNHAFLGRTCCKLQDVVLEVKGPCHCMVQVPVCVPGCCTDVPHISTGRDIFGRFSYTYQWRSGYKVDVVFRPRGDVMVHTWTR